MHTPHYGDAVLRLLMLVVKLSNAFLNKGDNTYFSLSHNIESALDLSICSPQISCLFECSVDSDIHHSDHYPIQIRTTFDSRTDCATGFVPRWNLKKADWGKFEEFCDIEYQQF